MNKNYSKLSDLNKSLIIHFCKELKIKTKITTDTTYNFKSKNRSFIYSTHQNYQELNYDKIISIENFKGIK